MSIRIYTDKPDTLVQKVKKLIDQNHIDTWTYDKEGDFTHSVQQFRNKAWLRPETTEDGLRMKVIKPKDEKSRARHLCDLSGALYRDAHYPRFHSLHEGSCNSRSYRWRLQRCRLTRPNGREIILSPAPELQPALLFAPTPKAAKRVLEFFTAQINNDHTRKAYLNATRRFAQWCDSRGIGQLADVQALHVAAFVKELQGEFSPPTVKQHLAALRMLFDWLVTGHVLDVNPPTPCVAPSTS